MSNLFKQTKDYTCGPAALSYLLATTRRGDFDQDYLEKMLHTTPEDGTSHEAIENFLRAVNIPFVSGDMRREDLCLPLLVNWYKEDDGHYSVITKVSFFWRGSEVVYFDPDDGDNHAVSFEDFEKVWYSPRYGKHWGLYIAQEKR